MRFISLLPFALTLLALAATSPLPSSSPQTAALEARALTAPMPTSSLTPINARSIPNSDADFADDSSALIMHKRGSGYKILDWIACHLSFQGKCDDNFDD